MPQSAHMRRSAKSGLGGRRPRGSNVSSQTETERQLNRRATEAGAVGTGLGHGALTAGLGGEGAGQAGGTLTVCFVFCVLFGGAALFFIMLC